jgi:hypothetical protein
LGRITEGFSGANKSIQEVCDSILDPLFRNFISIVQIIFAGAHKEDFMITYIYNSMRFPLSVVLVTYVC